MLNLVLLQAGANGSQLIMLVLIVVVFYFFMIRPQTKKAKEEKLFRESIQKGAKIVTIGGMHGKVLEVADSTVIIEVESGTRIRVDKSAISKDSSEAVQKGNTPAAAATPVK